MGEKILLDFPLTPFPSEVFNGQITQLMFPQDGYYRLPNGETRYCLKGEKFDLDEESIDLINRRLLKKLDVPTQRLHIIFVS